MENSYICFYKNLKADNTILWKIMQIWNLYDGKLEFSNMLLNMLSVWIKDHCSIYCTSYGS